MILQNIDTTNTSDTADYSIYNILHHFSIKINFPIPILILSDNESNSLVF